jgi:hypothetical protein
VFFASIFPVLAHFLVDTPDPKTPRTEAFVQLCSVQSLMSFVALIPFPARDQFSAFPWQRKRRMK